jgi:hypothetical protein
LPSDVAMEGKLQVYLHDKMTHAGHASRRDKRVHYVYSEQFQLTSAHEMMHVMLNGLNPRVPLRFEEGVCRVYESRMLTLGELTGTTTLYQLAKFAPTSTLTANEVFQNSYNSDEQGNVAAAFVAFLMNTVGEQQFWVFYRHVAQDAWRTQLNELLDMDPVETDLAFRRFVQNLMDPPPPFGAR